jgi:hypothetical protein
VKEEMVPFVEAARKSIGRLKGGISLMDGFREAADAERLAERRRLEERIEAVRQEHMKLERMLEASVKGNRKRGRSPASNKSTAQHTRCP